MNQIENKEKVIYLDNAATTRMSEEVKESPTINRKQLKDFGII